MTEKNVNIYQKLLKVRKAVPYLQKSAEGHQYQYVGSSAVLGAVREELDKQGLLLFPNVKDAKVSVSAVENKDKFGNLKITQTLLTELTIDFKWVDADTGESITIPFYAQGLDTGGEKGVGKALTYAEKYFLLKQFNIATDNADPDTFQNNLDNSMPKFISEEQAKELMNMVSETAKIRNVPEDSYLSALNIRNLDRLAAEQYLQVRGVLNEWLNNARQEAGKKGKPSTPVNQNTTVQDNSNEQKNQPVQEQSTDAEPTKLVTVDLYHVQKYEEGISPRQNPYVKLNVTRKDTGEVLEILVNDANVVAAAKVLQQGTEAQLSIYHDNGFIFLQDFKVISSGQQPAAQQEQTVPQGNNNQVAEEYEHFVFNGNENGLAPNGDPFAKVFVTHVGGNISGTLFAKGENNVNIIDQLQQGGTYYMKTYKENGFIFFDGLGEAHAS